METEKDFSRYGRVNYVLAKRLDLLKEVERLQASLGVTGDVSYTCETASHFYLYQVHARWEEFLAECRQKSNQHLDFVEQRFPFGPFFSNAPQPLFKVRDETTVSNETYESNFFTTSRCLENVLRRRF